MKGKYKNEPGECPRCSSYELDYEPVRVEGNMAYYRYTCNNCGQEGEEWYSLEFEGHNIYDENGEIIEL